jgi:hypothetical protein
MTSALLPTLDSPADLRRLSRHQLRQVADEVRQKVVDTVSQTGGHFGSNLGSVELTVALHFVFNTPYDRLVWDVGHQTYPHKILTGRRDRMHTLRQLGGVSGFPRREESEYDTFGVGHSSTSISAARSMFRRNAAIFASISEASLGNSELPPVSKCRPNSFARPRTHFQCAGSSFFGSSESCRKIASNFCAAQ